MDTWAGWHRAVIGEALSGADAFGPMARDLQGRSARWAQEHGIQQVFRRVRSLFGRATPVLIDRQRQSGGVVVSTLRPDAQFPNPRRRGRQTYIEVDTDPRRMAAHIAARAPNMRSVFLLVDPNTGALMQKQIFPVHGRPVIRNAPAGRGLTLTRSDVFDEFDA